MVKKFVPDNFRSWEEQYKILEKHHIKETTELFEKLQKLREQIKLLRDGKCLRLIPNTYIVCGEQDNFCSFICQRRAKKKKP